MTLRWRASSLAQALLAGDGVDLRVAHERDDLAVLVGDAPDELGALEQVGEAVGVQHDGDDVGRLGLVDLDERARAACARVSLEAVAQAHEPGALGAQVGAQALELGALGVEVGLDALLARLQRR